MASILILSHDQPLVVGLSGRLIDRGHQVRSNSAETNASHGGDVAPELVVLDLPRDTAAGERLIRRWRLVRPRPVVMVVAAMRNERDVVSILGSGADHYAPKPIGTPELVARVEALLRRAAKVLRPPMISRYADIELDRSSQRAWRNGRLLPIAPMEFRLLDALVARSGAAVSRSDLLECVWNSPRTRRTRTVDHHIAQLRRKLYRDPAHRVVIDTVWGFGYRLSTQCSSVAS